ncbi:MAG TPA: hypothetical protein VLC95_12920 [Anaerolineae bacterium]|nr:hypothetical protein [Anaerolineae bacterium]
MTEERTLLISELARRCAQEMARGRQGDEAGGASCYELFRRAVADRDQAAWDVLYTQYERLVRYWLGGGVQDPDALVARTFARFWQALPAERLGDFANLDKLLAYLKRCAQTTAIDARRQMERRRLREELVENVADRGLPGADACGDSVLARMEARELYEHALGCLQGPEEQLVFRASFEWQLSPREIAGRWPHVCADAREVSRVKERICRRLRRDEKCKNFGL